MLDVRTLYALQFLILIISTIIMTQVYVFNRKRFNGLIYWALMNGFTTIGVLMLALRGIIPVNLSIVLSNFSLYLAIAWIHVGVRKFFGAHNLDVLTLIIIANAFLLSIIFTFAFESILVRTLLLSVLYLIFCIRSAWFLYHHPQKETREQTIPIKINLIIIAAINLYRIITQLFHPYQTENIFEENIFEVIYFILITMAMFYLLFNMITMVSKKLYYEVKQEKEKFNLLFNQSPTASVITRYRQGIIIDVNPRLLSILGYSREDVVGKSVNDDGVLLKTSTRQEIIEKLSTSRMISGLEMDLRTKDGHLVHMLYSAVLIEMNGESYVLASMEDITEMNKLKETLHDLATHDFLTHLPNRDLFVSFFHEITKTSVLKDQQIGVAMIDFDDFKNINDDYGHDIGDRVLVHVAKKLEKALYTRGMVTRFGGDEFALIVTSGSTNLDPFFRKLHDDLSQPVIIEDHEIKINVSIGVTFYPVDGNDIHALLKKSDMLLYEGKRTGKNKVVFSNESK
jgi:diguanylate cyclase (GGDEF)-like protein/PAS domain S-box-containing protein